MERLNNFGMRGEIMGMPASDWIDFDEICNL